MKAGLYQIIKGDSEEINLTDRFIELLPCYSLSYSRSRFLRLKKRVENDKTLLLKMIQRHIKNQETTDFSLEMDGILPYMKILDKPIGIIDEKDIITAGLISNEQMLHYSRYNGYSYSRGFGNNTEFRGLNKDQIVGLAYRIFGKRLYSR